MTNAELFDLMGFFLVSVVILMIGFIAGKKMTK
jgi:hypothetical protein